MIKFNLHGELGNQMFEWATGIAFANKAEVPVSFLTLPDVTFRMAEFKTAKNFQVESTTGFTNSISIARKISRKIHLKANLGLSQNEVGLNYQNLELGKSRNYHGYFQSWRYFHYMRKEILDEFVLLNPSNNFYEVKESFPAKFTAVHIRRGGTGPSILASNYHGLLDLEYYQRAIQLNFELQGSANYIVFTDNPSKAKEIIDQLDFNCIKIIGPDDTHSQSENLILMASATSFIGANSSYSWWAAYLNDKLQSRPIFPRQWYMNPDLSNTDMLLPDWVSIGFSKFSNEKQTRGIYLE